MSGMTGVDHVVIRVKDLDDGIKTYRDVLGFALSRTAQNPAIGKQAFFDLPDGGFIELVAPLTPDSAVGKALEKNGEGIHTIALAVDDLAATAAALKARGASLIGGGPVQFVHPKSTHGVLLQLFEKKK
jgi:methylmalonyl-CoA/ethylmalonyl-CoA epimerase